MASYYIDGLVGIFRTSQLSRANLLDFIRGVIGKAVLQPQGLLVA